jgi:hypothetical protein
VTWRPIIVLEPASGKERLHNKSRRGGLSAPTSALHALAEPAIEYECQSENSPNTADPTKREILDAVKRWYQYDWFAIENKHDVVPGKGVRYAFPASWGDSNGRATLSRSRESCAMSDTSLGLRIRDL